MEILAEIFFLILQFLAEILLQVFAEWLAEMGVRTAGAPFRREREVNPWLAAFGYAVLGGLAGWLSLVFFPNSFLTSDATRVVNLILSPLAAGVVMSMLGSWRQSRGQDLIRLDRFACGALFAFAMAVIRFFFAQHGG